MGAHFAKSKVVHRFEELVQDGAQALIDDIIAIYHYYCTGRIVLNSGENDEVQAVDVVGTEKYQLPTIPKSIQFLPILFEGRSIKHFNIAMYLDALKTQQDEDHYRVVQIRWQAIQAYFAGDI